MRRESTNASETSRPGQLNLTRSEVRSLSTANQHSSTGLTVIEWQCVKAAAAYFDVSDWTSKVDPALTYEENIELMRESGSGLTLRSMNRDLAGLSYPKY